MEQQERDRQELERRESEQKELERHENEQKELERREAERQEAEHREQEHEKLVQNLREELEQLKAEARCWEAQYAALKQRLLDLKPSPDPTVNTSQSIDDGFLWLESRLQAAQRVEELEQQNMQRDAEHATQRIQFEQKLLDEQTHRARLESANTALEADMATKELAIQSLEKTIQDNLKAQGYELQAMRSGLESTQRELSAKSAEANLLAVGIAELRRQLGSFEERQDTMQRLRQAAILAETAAEWVERTLQSPIAAGRTTPEMDGTGGMFGVDLGLEM
nr:hypothetical protein HK105_007179 [Polyrhizophydium stewartii]